MNNQTLILKDRTNLEITAVKNVISFDPTNFLLESALGNINVKGKNLTLVKMDTDKQELSIKGQIDSVSYVKDLKNKEEKKENIFAKLFK